MKKTIVIYYSKNGSNKYLAEKISQNLKCDIEPIRPRLNVFLLLLFGISLGNRSLKHRLKEYDRVILCGPIWMGKFISPLRSFVNKYGSKINELCFVTCCGSSYAAKDEKFGHGLVFQIVKNLLGEKCIHCEAFPIVLVVADDKKGDGNTIMKNHLSDSNFTGEIKERFENFIKKISEIQT